MGAICSVPSIRCNCNLRNGVLVAFRIVASARLRGQALHTWNFTLCPRSSGAVQDRGRVLRGVQAQEGQVGAMHAARHQHRRRAPRQHADGAVARTLRRHEVSRCTPTLLLHAHARPAQIRPWGFAEDERTLVVLQVSCCWRTL